MKAHQLHAALAAYQEGQYAQAEAMLLAALQADGDVFDALHVLGLACHKRGKSDVANAALLTAISLCPQDAAALSNYCKVLEEQGRFEEAAQMGEQALAIDPASVAAHINLGNAYFKLRKVEEALRHYEAALALGHRSSALFGTLGNIVLALGQTEEAKRHFETALRLDPRNADAQYAYAGVLLADGAYIEGFRRYEWRWHTSHSAHVKRDHAFPQLQDLSDVSGKSILVHSDQGLGDCIQFSRYVPVLAERGARVYFAVPAPLLALMQESLGAYAQIFSNRDIPVPDYHCPVMSLPYAFGSTVDTIPSQPYLYADQARLARWQAIFDTSSRPRVGLVWNANRHNAAVARYSSVLRSLPLGALLPVLRMEAITPVSLQKDLSEAEQLALGFVPHLVDAGGQVQDFADTAAVIAQLDLVITVDTAVAHLAGAMGKPVWILLQKHPDWRWMRERSDNPWYPTARLFRQTVEGDWTAVMAELVPALRAWAAARTLP